MESCKHNHTITGNPRVFEAGVAERPEAVNSLAHGGFEALEICRDCGHWRNIAWNGRQYEYGEWHRPMTYGLWPRLGTRPKRSA